jgi:hypothetical protein
LIGGSIAVDRRRRRRFGGRDAGRHADCRVCKSWRADADYPRADSHECRGAFRFASLFVNFGVEDLPDAAPGDSVQPPSPAWIIEVFGRR